MKNIGIVLTLLVLGGIALFNWARPGQAEVLVNVITVTTITDAMTNDSACSLREALHNVNSGGAFSPAVGECAAGSATLPNIIVLASDETYNLTIAGTGDNEGDLDVRNDVRFETSGAGKATIAMTLVGQRVMEIHGATVEIDNLSLTGGNTADFGGGILNSGGDLTLTRVDLLNNSANAGGGLYNNNGTVLVSENSQIVLNGGALGGGGIFNNGDLTLDGSIVRANNSSGGSGGGIFNDAGTLLVQANGAVNLNSAAFDGGGIYNTNGGAVTIQDSLVEGNTAVENGGGIFSTGNAEDSSLSLHNSIVRSNTATNDSGGGIRLVHSATVSQLPGADNQAGNDGGGVHATHGLIWHGGVVENNSAVAFGGGLRMNILEANHLLVQGNTAIRGGGIYMLSSIRLHNSQVLDNTATGTGGGGGIYVATVGLHHIQQTVIANNEATAGPGGGIWINHQLLLANSTISNNTAFSGGGGLHIAGQGDVTATNVTLALNNLDLFKEGELTLQNSIIATPDQPNCFLVVTPINSLGHNISDDASCGGLDEPTDLTDTNPLLLPLADNGGNTLTHALQPGSPALDAGNAAACVAFPVNGVDQRGIPRPSGVGCDIGAFEYGFALYLPVIQR